MQGGKFKSRMRQRSALSTGKPSPAKPFKGLPSAADIIQRRSVALYTFTLSSPEGITHQKCNSQMAMMVRALSTRGLGTAAATCRLAVTVMALPAGRQPHLRQREVWGGRRHGARRTAAGPAASELPETDHPDSNSEYANAGRPSCMPFQC